MLEIARRSYVSSAVRARVLDRFSFSRVAQDLIGVYTAVGEAGSKQRLGAWDRSVTTQE
jgi:hypothetical protein